MENIYRELGKIYEKGYDEDGHYYDLDFIDADGYHCIKDLASEFLDNEKKKGIIADYIVKATYYNDSGIYFFCWSDHNGKLYTSTYDWGED